MLYSFLEDIRQISNEEPNAEQRQNTVMSSVPRCQKQCRFVRRFPSVRPFARLMQMRWDSGRTILNGEKTLTQCRSLHHKSQKDWRGTAGGSPRQTPATGRDRARTSNKIVQTGKPAEQLC